VEKQNRKSGPQEFGQVVLTCHKISQILLLHLPKVSSLNLTSYFSMIKKILSHFYKSLIGEIKVVS
jgi:hypothetical protein